MVRCGWRLFHLCRSVSCTSRFPVRGGRPRRVPRCACSCLPEQVATSARRQVDAFVVRRRRPFHCPEQGCDADGACLAGPAMPSPRITGLKTFSTVFQKKRSKDRFLSNHPGDGRVRAGVHRRLTKPACRLGIDAMYRLQRLNVKNTKMPFFALHILQLLGENSCVGCGAFRNRFQKKEQVSLSTTGLSWLS